VIFRTSGTFLRSFSCRTLTAIVSTLVAASLMTLPLRAGAIAAALTPSSCVGILFTKSPPAQMRVWPAGGIFNLGSKLKHDITYRPSRSALAVRGPCALSNGYQRINSGRRSNTFTDLQSHSRSPAERRSGPRKATSQDRDLLHSMCVTPDEASTRDTATSRPNNWSCGAIIIDDRRGQSWRRKNRRAC